MNTLSEATEVKIENEKGFLLLQHTYSLNIKKLLKIPIFGTKLGMQSYYYFTLFVLLISTIRSPLRWEIQENLILLSW